MDERIQKIQDLLTEIGNELEPDNDHEFVRNYDALELPDIVSKIIQHLQPALNPYEAAIYWHMFFLSVLQTGQQYCRVSSGRLMKGVIKSIRGDTDDLALSTIRIALQGLVTKGAILQSGETNREGTLYKVFLPEEIQICIESMQIKQSDSAQSIDIKNDLDYYNVQENRLRIFERDFYKCRYCAKQLTRFTATLDHIQPVSKGGDNSYDNLVTACLHCNSRRGAQPVMQALIQGKGQDA